jgi:LPXTG-site transpeptidase (sortase) family protein
LVTPERIAADAVSAAEEFPSLLARRSDPVWSVVGPPTGAVAARPVPTGGAEVAPARGDRSRRWLPLGVILAASVAIVALLFLVGQVLPSAIKSSSQLPGSPEAPTGAVIAVIVVAAAAIVAARRRILDSRVIGTGLAIVLLLIAAQLLKTPGASADIREIPGQVNGLIQQTVAQPEPGYPRIRIKRVGIDLLMVKGDGRTPPVKYEAFTYPRADHVLAQQGTAGNTYVYAHARTGMFWNLHDVNIGDTIEIDYGGGKISRYRISEIHKSVSWKDFEWLQPTSDNRLTLQTCNGWRDEDPRLIVVAHPVPDTSTALAH